MLKCFMYFLNERRTSDLPPYLQHWNGENNFCPRLAGWAVFCWSAKVVLWERDWCKTGSSGSTGRDTCMSAHTRTVRMGGSTAWPEGLPPVESLSLGLPDWGSGSGPRLVRLRTEGCQCEGGVEPGSYCPSLVRTTGVLGGQEWSPVHSQHRAE